MNTDFMRAAIQLARDKMRANAGGPFGAVIVRESRIIARGWNQVTSANDPTAHAEIVAIREACSMLGTFVLDGCELYASCEPCPMCLAAIYWARVPVVFFAGSRADAASAGFDDDLIYRHICQPQSQGKLSLQPLLREEVLSVFQEWKDKPDKVPY